jgi:hypothetical protein
MLMISVFPFLFFIVYLVIIAAIIYMIYKWVTKIIALKQEHNDLLKEIIRKMESR